VNEAKLFMEAVFGEDWEERLILGGAVAGPTATDREVLEARQRAVELAKERHPEWNWEDERLVDVANAWMELWNDVPTDGTSGLSGSN
jgi:hypothetical protein